MTDRDIQKDRLILESPEKMCEYCCNFDKEHIGMDCTALCKLTMTLAYAEDYGGNCMFYNVPKEQIIIPPCKVGDKVYRVMADKRIKQPYQYKVIGFWYSADETCNNLHLVRYVNGVFESSMSVPFSEFNRILFLTKEEAEKALAERNKNESIS